MAQPVNAPTISIDPTISNHPTGSNGPTISNDENSFIDPSISN